MPNPQIDPVIRDLILHFVKEMLEGAEEMIAALMQAQQLSREDAFQLVFSCQVSALASLGSVAGIPPLEWIRQVKGHVDEIERRTAGGELQVVMEGQTAPGPGGQPS